MTSAYGDRADMARELREAITEYYSAYEANQLRGNLVGEYYHRVSNLLTNIQLNEDDGKISAKEFRAMMTKIKDRVYAVKKSLSAADWTRRNTELQDDDIDFDLIQEAQSKKEEPKPKIKSQPKIKSPPLNVPKKVAKADYVGSDDDSDGDAPSPPNQPSSPKNVPSENAKSNDLPYVMYDMNNINDLFRAKLHMNRQIQDQVFRVQPMEVRQEAPFPPEKVPVNRNANVQEELDAAKKELESTQEDLESTKNQVVQLKNEIQSFKQKYDEQARKFEMVLGLFKQVGEK